METLDTLRLGGQAGWVYAQKMGTAIAVGARPSEAVMHKRFLVALLAVVLAGVMIPAVAGARGPTLLYEWGNFGTGDGEFIAPQGVAVDGSGNVYVADCDNPRIQKFDSGGGYFAQWGTSGSGNGQFASPIGVAVDAGGNVYVADNNNHRIQKFTSDGTYLTQWGSEGTGDGQFNHPCGVAVGPSGSVYVTDRHNYRIQKFSSSGTYLTQWSAGDGWAECPQGVAVDASGNAVYVAVGGNTITGAQRIQKFTSDGTFLTQWGTYGSGNGQFSCPQGVAVDGSGNVYVADTNNHRIQQFTSDGTFVLTWFSFSPCFVAVAASGNVYVADTFNSRIQVFGSPPTPAQSTSWGRIKSLYR
jgi:tripartite motif-containing protein 71